MGIAGAQGSRVQSIFFLSLAGVVQDKLGSKGKGKIRQGTATPAFRASVVIACVFHVSKLSEINIEQPTKKAVVAHCSGEKATVNWLLWDENE